MSVLGNPNEPDIPEQAEALGELDVALVRLWRAGRTLDQLAVDFGAGLMVAANLVTSVEIRVRP